MGWGESIRLRRILLSPHLPNKNRKTKLIKDQSPPTEVRGVVP